VLRVAGLMDALSCSAITSDVMVILLVKLSELK
jgi:hypothetical protein